MSTARPQTNARRSARTSFNDASKIRGNNRKTTKGRNTQHVGRKVIRHQSN